LRQLSFEQLVRLHEPSETVHIQGRQGAISIIVEPWEGEQFQVIVQGFLDGRILKRVQTVALHGFRIHSSGTISEMESSDFYGYD